MKHLLLELIRPSPSEPSLEFLEELTGRGTWPQFCALLHHSGLVPLAYERLRFYRRLIPDDILEWLYAQYYQTIRRNLFLLSELDRIMEKFTAAGVESLVLKGLAFAHLTHAPERVFGDLDILVKPDEVFHADRIIQSIGYVQILGEHPYHNRYVRPNGIIPARVEIHFDLHDRNKSYSPDVSGIWSRSAVAKVFGVTSRVPDVTDHLLLVMLQLPHHHWALRLIWDIVQVVSKRGDDVKWCDLATRATEWRMRALVGSALCVVASALQLPFPQDINSFLEPESYFRRVQWQIVRAAVSERLSGRDTRISRLARYLLVDRPGDVRTLLLQKGLSGSVDESENNGRAGRRSLLGVVSACPEFLAVLVRSLPRTSWTIPGQRSYGL